MSLYNKNSSIQSTLSTQQEKVLLHFKPSSSIIKVAHSEQCLSEKYGSCVLSGGRQQ